MVNNKRVIVVGDSDFAPPHVRAFQVLGFECIEFKNREGVYYSSKTVRRLMRIFPRLRFFKKLVMDQTNKKLVSLVKEYKPFLVFSIKAENIYPETIEEINKMGVKTGCFFVDWIDQWSTISKIAPAYDLFFAQCHVVLRRLWDELGLKNCFFMAHSTEPTPENKLVKNKKYDISFIGTRKPEYYSNRERYLMSIKDLGLNIWGTNDWTKTPLAECFHGVALDYQRFGIYSQSKIVVDVKRDSILLDGLSNRPFEVTGCGALYITNCPPEDVERVYRVNNEVVSVKDEVELRERVIYYLGHEKEREEVARAAYIRTVAEHTYVNRVKQILDTIEHPDKYLYK